MPNGYYEWGVPPPAVTRPSAAEEAAFNDWLEEKYGIWATIGKQLTWGAPWWENNPEYNEWVSLGKPAAPSGQAVPAAEEEGEDIIPVSEMSPGIWLYSDGKYRDQWGLPSEGWSAEEARAQVEPTGMTPEEQMEYDVEYQRRVYEATHPTQPPEPYEEETALARLQILQQQLEGFGEMTPTQQESFDLELQRLQWEMQKFGMLSAAQQAELGLAQQQLGLQRNEWLAGLQASPATFPERWFAERLPWEEQRLPLESDVYTQQGAYPMGGAGTTPAGGTGMPPTGTTPTGAGWQQPTGGGMPSTLGQGWQTPEGMTPEQAQTLYTPQQLQTGLIGAGEANPIRRYLIKNIGEMSDEEIAFWRLYPDAQGLAAQRARAEEISAALGLSLGVGEIRDYARYVKKQHDWAEAQRLNIYPEAPIEEWGEYPWRTKLRKVKEAQPTIIPKSYTPEGKATWMPTEAGAPYTGY